MQHIGWSSSAPPARVSTSCLLMRRYNFRSRAYFEDLLHIHVGLERTSAPRS